MASRVHGYTIGCDSAKCNIRNICHSTYTCAYKKPAKVMSLSLIARQKEATGSAKPFIQQQREAQAKVMVNLKARWAEEARREAQMVAGVAKRPEGRRPESAHSYSDFELFPTNGPSHHYPPPRQLPPMSHPHGHPLPSPSSCDPSVWAQSQLPRDITQPRPVYTQLEAWEGVPYPFTDPQYEMLIPSSHSTFDLAPSVNPFVYLGRKRKPPISNGCPAICGHKRELFGHPVGIDLTTSLQGIRAQRKHFHPNPTFLWLPMPNKMSKVVPKPEDPCNTKSCCLGYRPNDAIQKRPPFTWY